MRIVSMSCALAAVIAFQAVAHAATVRAVQGQVLVNAGQGYRLVDGATQLEAGGTVVANPGSLAEVAYADGCTVTVQPGSVYLVAASPPCQRGEPTRSGGLPSDTSTPTRPPTRPTETADGGGGGSGMSTGTAWTLGAVAVIGGGAAAYFLIPPMSP